MRNLMATVAAVGAACLLATGASAQVYGDVDGPVVGTSADTVPGWNDPGSEWTPPAPGRVASDWVYGDRFDPGEVIIWNPVQQRMIDGLDVVTTTINRPDQGDVWCENAALWTPDTPGYHASWMEQQHAPMDIGVVWAMWDACPPQFDEDGNWTGGAFPGTRVSETTETQIQRALDSGAMVLFVPTVDSYEEALEVVQWSHFPPVGKRSSGGGPAFGFYSNVPGGYRNTFNDNLVLVVMIETLWGVDDVEKIANIEYIDGLFAASGDLGNFSGYSAGEEPYDWLIAQVRDAALNAGKAYCTSLGWHPARNPDNPLRQGNTCFQGGRNAANDLVEQGYVAP